MMENNLRSKEALEKFTKLVNELIPACDRVQIKDKWSPIVKAWFPDGENDPNLSLLKITPVNCYYLESGSSKMVSFFKMAVAAITGNQKLADSEEGKLSL
jgi:general stress protein 26